MRLRDCNATYAGKRIAASPYVGVLASQIAAETADGDHGPGILHNEAIDPAYAGQYLRAWITNPPAVGSLELAENGAIVGYDLPDGEHVFNYDVLVNYVYDSSSYFVVQVGAVSATAPGATLTGSASISPGVATGEVNATAAGVTLTGSASIETGSASGGASATAPGVTLTGSASIDPGSAQGVSVGTAPGVTLTGTASLEPGSATGNQAATAPGVTLTGTASLTPGAAVAINPDATAPGVVLTGSATLVPGVASDGSVVDLADPPWRLQVLPRVFGVISINRVFRVTTMTRQLPTKDVEETKKITFDFSRDADALSSPDVSVVDAEDAGSVDIASMKVGAAVVSGATVTQLISGGESGKTYRVRCRASDPDGEVHVLAANLVVEVS